MNIRKSMYLTITVMILIPFFIFSLLISGIYNERLKTGIEDSLQAVANAQITEMTSFCEQQMDSLLTMGDTSVFHAALRGQLDDDTLDYVDDLLASRVSAASYLESSTLIDHDYQVVACSEDDYDLQANEGFDTLVDSIGEDGFYITNVLNSRVGSDEHQAVVAIARIEDQEELLGYLLAEISLDFYTSIRRQSMQWNDATFYLLDGNGTIISAGTAQDDRTAFITTKEERADYNAKYNAIDHELNPQGSITYKVNGVNYITYYSDIDYTKWTMMLTVNLDQYLANKTVHVLLVCFLVLLCILLSLWIGFFTSKRIMKPVSRITDTLHEVTASQDYSLRIPVERKDEMGHLSEHINSLLDFIETENLTEARKQRILREQAEQDPLTKVMNKTKIEQYLQEALTRCRENRLPLTVLFADIDNFKFFNSQYGHSVGDQVLQFFAALLERQTEGAVGRLGGDEFLVVLENPGTINNLEFYLKKIRLLADTRFVIRGGEQAPVSCCIGAVCADFSADSLDDITAQELINQADALMYQVKNHGKHGYIIEDSRKTAASFPSHEYVSKPKDV